jgi:glutathione S-transferase
MKLYLDHLRTSPYAMYVFVALREKTLDFDVAEIALERKEQMEPKFRAISLNGKIPCLEDNDFSVSESSAILEYLEEKYPAPKYTSIFPKDLKNRATARQVMSWLNSDFMGLRSDLSTHTFLYPEQGPCDLGPQGRADADRLLNACEGLVPKDSRHLFGDWCIADTALGLMLNRLAQNHHALPQHIASYAQTQWNRPTVKEWHTHARPPYVAYR